MNTADRDIADMVDRHGWAVIRIEKDDSGPAFAYTVGLYRQFECPEIIVFGLDIDIMQAILNRVGELAAGGHVFGPSSTSDAVLQGYEVIFQEVHPAACNTFFGATIRYYGNSEFPALHCVWPDRAGLFPWQKGVADIARFSQPDISSPLE